MTGILFLVAVVAAVLAVVFFAQARSAGEAVLALRAELDQQTKSTEADRAQTKQTQAELKAKGQQLLELREKLAEVRKKGEKGPAKAAPRGAREAELEEDLTHARRLTEEAHAAEQAARKEAQASKAAEALAKAELSKAQEKVRELAARPAAAPAELPAAAPDAGLVDAARKADERRKEAEARAAEFDGQLQALREKELKLREEAKKARGRAETNNKVYLVTKSELDFARERLAAAERRLWQAGLTLPAPSPKERPKATGPASADRPRDPKPTGAESVEPAPAASSSGEPPAAPAAASEPAAGAPDATAVLPETSQPAGAEPGPEPVPPLRRRPASDPGPAKA
jgi:hypothetical protein